MNAVDSGTPQEIVAQQGDSLYLIGRKGDRDPRRKVRVLDTQAQTLSALYPLQMVLSHGYWQSYEGDQGALPSLMVGVSARL